MNNDLSLIQNGSIVRCIRAEGLEAELKDNRLYKVDEVRRVGPEYQDWYVNLVGLKRICDYGFCISRFELVTDPAVVCSYEEGVRRVKDLALSAAFFPTIEQWRAYKDAVSVFVPFLDGDE